MAQVDDRPARLSSEQSLDQTPEEEEALLTGEQVERHRRGFSWRDTGLFAWALVATCAVIVLAVLLERGDAPAGPPKGKRNLVMMVSDGMGPTSLSLTRSYKQAANKLPYGSELFVDSHLIGQSRTRSTSSLVTDSAAGATAFSCGFKSYNGAIAVLPDHTPCGTVLEAAKMAGYMTGLVVTTRITDATPACFAAHVNMRDEEDRIAEQLIGNHPLGRMVDIILGGGRCHFLPNTTAGSCRNDRRDMIDAAKKSGWTYASTRKDFDNLMNGDAVKFPLLGLFSDTDIPYEIDRRFQTNVYPSLDEMATTALNALSKATKNSDKGFFVMIEGSRIDHAGHANDPSAQVHEVLAFDKAFEAVVKFLDKDKVPGVMVSTSDHETGGLAVARQINAAYPEYLWYPDVLVNATNSVEKLSNDYYKHRQSSPAGNMATYVKTLAADGLGIHDISDAEVAQLVDHPENAPYALADMISRRAQTGWSTHGHSAADVNIYTSDKVAAAALIGNHENTEVGNFLRDYLEVDVEQITRELIARGPQFSTMENGVKMSWLGPVGAEGQRLDGQDHIDHYKGDYKKHRRCEICA